MEPPEHCPEEGVITTPPTNPEKVCEGACEIGPESQSDRAKEARRIRLEAAWCPHQDPRCKQDPEQGYPVCGHPCNGDEAYYYQSETLPGGEPNPFKGYYLASFTKGLPHDPQTGLGDPYVYCLLLKALATGEPQDFENVRPLGCERRLEDFCKQYCEPPGPPLPPPGLPPPQRALENPQAAYAYELEGADSHSLYMPPAPCFASEREAAEIAELYWMALTRDIPFSQYESHPLIQNAVADLNNWFAPHLSPYLQFPLTERTVFRGPTRGDRQGPAISQFLLLDVPYGAQFIPAMIRTLLPGIDFMTNWDDWLAVQDGCDANQSNCDPVFRLIRNGRDIGQFVHVDRIFNAFLNACAILLYGREPLRRCEARPGLGVPFGPCLPYVNSMAPLVEEFPRSRNPYKGKSENQIGQGTFGDQHIKSAVVGSMYRALHAVWYQKWLVHRRLRPEEFGGRVHLRRLYDDGSGNPMHAFPINPLLFNSDLFTNKLVFNYNECQNANRRTPPEDRLGRPSWDGTYLLPVEYAEGSPLHPAYGSGHSTGAGCMTTILKAFFHNDWRFPNPVESNEDGTSLRPYMGPDACELTVAGELDKLASNIGIGRLWGGVHWRSDHEEALILGEQMAISILCDQRNTYNEPYEFRFRSFDFGPYGGRVVRIRPSDQWWDPNHPDSCEPCVELLEPGQYEEECGKRRRPEEPEQGKE